MTISLRIGSGGSRILCLGGLMGRVYLFGRANGAGIFAWGANGDYAPKAQNCDCRRQEAPHD